jgi:hypothetical protein
MCWARPKSFVLLVCVAMLARSGLAHAETPAADGVDPAAALRVCLLDAPRELERALRTALLPWGMQVENVVRDKPVSTLPGAAIYANALAHELAADALVWLSSSPEGAALWSYQVSSDSVMARPAPERRLDEPLAAALALSVKTWLQHPALPASVAGTSPTDAPRASESAALPPAPAGVAAELDRPSAQTTRIRTDDVRADTARWQIVIHAAGRGGFERKVVETRYALEARAAAWRSDAGLTRLWLGLRLETGEPRTVAGAAFRGTYSELGAGLSVGVSHRIGSVLNLGIQGGATLHNASIYGTLLPDGAAAERSRLSPALRVGPEVELLLEPLGVIFQAVLGTSPRRLIYEVDEVEVLETSQVWWLLGGALRVGLF